MSIEGYEFGNAELLQSIFKAAAISLGQTIGTGSLVVGDSTTTSASTTLNSVGFGDGINVTGTENFVAGLNATDGGADNCVVIGSGASCAANNGIAVGTGATAGDDSSDTEAIAIGKNCVITALGGVGVGNDIAFPTGSNNDSISAFGNSISLSGGNNGGSVLAGEGITGQSYAPIANVAVGQNIIYRTQGAVMIGAALRCASDATTLLEAAPSSVQIGTSSDIGISCFFSTVIGANTAINSADAATNSYRNCIFGYSSSLETGQDNVLFGSLIDLDGAASENTIVGAASSGDGGDNNIGLGFTNAFSTYSNCGLIGDQLTATKDNDWQIGNSASLYKFAGYFDDNINFALLNGTFKESFDALVTSDGVTVTMSIEQTGTGDLRMQFSDGESTLDCTPADTVTLTAGSDASPTENYVYVLQSTKALTVSTSDWPATEHIKVGYFLVPSAGFVQTSGCYINQNWNDHMQGTDNMGHIAHMAERSRRLGAIYRSGIAGNGTDGYLTPTASNVELKATAGVIWQMHKHTVPAFDTSTGDEVLVKNWSGDSYHNITNLFDITADSTGTTITNNKYFNLVLWAVGNKAGEYTPMLINLPSGFYNTQLDAENDVSGYDDFTIPSQFAIESSTGFLIARITIQMGTTWSVTLTKDLRGSTPQAASGGASGVSSEFVDNTFRVHDESDVTKELAFECSGITTATTRTVTIPDQSGTMALTLFEDDQDLTFGTASDGAIRHNSTTGDLEVDPGAGEVQIGDSVTPGNLLVGSIGLGGTASSTNAYINFDQDTGARGALSFIANFTSGTISANINNYAKLSTSQATSYAQLNDWVLNVDRTGTGNYYALQADIGVDNSLQVTGGTYNIHCFRATHGNGTGDATTSGGAFRLYGFRQSAFSDIAGSATTTKWGSVWNDDVQINDDVKLILGGSDTSKEDNYWAYDTTDTQSQFFQAGSQVVAIDSVVRTEVMIGDFYANSASSSFTTGTVTVPFDTTRYNAGSLYTLASSQITLPEDGTYKIEFRVTAEISSGTTRTTTNAWLEEDSSGSFVEVDGSRVSMYNRTAGESATTGSAVVVLTGVTGGDKVQVICDQTGAGGATMNTVADMCGITITKVSAET